MKKIFISIAVLLVAFLVFFWTRDYSSSRQMIFGVTFSQPQAEYLGLDWKKTYLDILDNLKVRNLRLLAYWPKIEKERGKFDFSDLDWQVNEAKKRNGKIIMTIGERLPHWPECHTPNWAKDLSKEQKQARIIEMLQAVVKHYKKQNNIIMWQVDNEPLVNWFGECGPADKDFVKKEITLVKSMDWRPVLITDSGELGWWRPAARMGDFFGTTLYRVVWNKYVGYWNYKYLIPPAFYYWKARLAGIYPAGAIIVELQAEPWLREDISKITLEEQRHSMDAVKFKEAVSFASRTGFAESYLWGAEYWYWLKEKKGDTLLYDEAKKVWLLTKP